MRAIRIFLYNLFPLIGKSLRNFYVLAMLQGQKSSIKSKASINAHGEPIPWFTYPAIEYLNRFDFSQMNILEFGSGNSTLFWARKAKSIISIEHEPEWFHRIKPYGIPNLKIYLKPDKEKYVGSLQELNMLFDIIIIDGRWRNACSRLILNYLKDGGFIIFDNSDWYPNASKLLRDKGLFQIDFNGFGPINDYCWTTSIFIKAHNRTQNDYMHVLPIGGISHTRGDDE